MASVISVVEAAPLPSTSGPPVRRIMSYAWTSPSLTTAATASRIAFARSISPTWSSSIAAVRIIAIGFTIDGSRSAYLGADPCVGSNTATSSPMFAEQAKPRPPTRPAKASDTMSPNMLPATITE